MNPSRPNVDLSEIDAVANEASWLVYAGSLAAALGYAAYCRATRGTPRIGWNWLRGPFVYCMR